ncbi:transcriptional protein SWT1 isoform X1 [Xyrichtys novacula]|uniref:Transcriptional protein SWT1 n=1 Tax=Xyrichtys novacula TaxID=13765 RepID=A0AAV1FIF1_XYRNO|nr:transcriptional protein SWT1 isoform X1 [Xyrichtys novacula]
MSKKSKKRKRKRFSSSSDEEEKRPRHERDKKSSRHDKRKESENSTERCAEKREKSDSRAVKDDSQSTRQIKKPVYRLTKTHATEQKPVNKEEESRKTKSDTVSPQGEHRSSKAKHDTSGKDKAASGSRTVDKGMPKPSNSRHTSTVPLRTEETSKRSPDEKSSHRSLSKLKKEIMSPSLVTDKHKEADRNALKKRPAAEERQRSYDDRHSIKTSTPGKTSHVSKDCVKQTGKELVQETCGHDDEITIKVKTDPCAEVKTPFISTKVSSFTLAKPSTSVSSSNMVNNFTPVEGNISCMTNQTVKSSSAKKSSILSPFAIRFKIPKKVKPKPLVSITEDKNTFPVIKNIRKGTEPPNSEASASKSKQETVPQTYSRSAATPSVSSEGQEKRPPLSGQPPALFDTPTKPVPDQVVEELHLARSEKRLEVDVMQSYGELTCMEIDPPEETAESHCRQPLQQDLILVLDTNILISHLDYVKKIVSHGLKALGSPVVLIPWVVLQELDSLKQENGLSGSVAHRARPAISYIYNSLKSREPRLWGQSMQQAAKSKNDLKTENNDDRVLQCCLQYQSLYPGCALILCTDDKNLCSKALLSGVKALSKSDLEVEAGQSSHGFNPLQSIKTSTLPHISPQVSSAALDRSFQQRSEPSVGLRGKDYKQQSNEEDEEEAHWDRRCVSEFEDCLREVLSDVLEVEMEAAFGNLWLEIVMIKPPWTLQEVLQCLRKHWIAVFGQVVPRRMEQTVSSLIDFFHSGQNMDRSGTKAAIQMAKEFVKAFGKRSNCVPGAITKLENLFNKLQPQSSRRVIDRGESPASDVVMNEDYDEEKQPTSAQVSHQEVWALFEDIWSKLFQTSLQVFKALGFDPHTMQRAQPAGGPLPPQDALHCLHNLSSVVSQLLQAFSSVLSSAHGAEEAHTLFTIIHSNEIVEVDSRLTAQHLHDCFSQQEYREKLSAGGNCLLELKGALDRCLWTCTSQS